MFLTPHSAVVVRFREAGSAAGTRPYTCRARMFQRPRHVMTHVMMMHAVLRVISWRALAGNQCKQGVGSASAFGALQHNEVHKRPKAKNCLCDTVSNNCSGGHKCVEMFHTPRQILILEATHSNSKKSQFLCLFKNLFFLENMSGFALLKIEADKNAQHGHQIKCKCFFFFFSKRELSMQSTPQKFLGSSCGFPHAAADRPKKNFHKNKVCPEL